LSIAAATAALEDYGWMQENVAHIRRTRSDLIRGLQGRGFAVLPSASNFVLARKPGESQESTYLQLKRRGILVRYFPLPELHDALRITVGTDEEIAALLQALDDVMTP